MGFRIAVVSALLLSLFPVAFNFSEVNQSNDYAFEDYTRTILNKHRKKFGYLFISMGLSRLGFILFSVG